jgi:hypothetical protein
VIVKTNSLWVKVTLSRMEEPPKSHPDVSEKEGSEHEIGEVEMEVPSKLLKKAKRMLGGFGAAREILLSIARDLITYQTPWPESGFPVATVAKRFWTKLDDLAFQVLLHNEVLEDVQKEYLLASLEAFEKEDVNATEQAAHVLSLFRVFLKPCVHLKRLDEFIAHLEMCKRHLFPERDHWRVLSVYLEVCATWIGEDLRCGLSDKKPLAHALFEPYAIAVMSCPVEQRNSIRGRFDTLQREIADILRSMPLELVPVDPSKPKKKRRKRGKKAKEDDDVEKSDTKKSRRKKRKRRSEKTSEAPVSQEEEEQAEPEPEPVPVEAGSAASE